MTTCRPLRIVHLDTGKALRGGQRQLLLLARGLRRRSHTQLIVCPEESGLEARARQEGFDVYSLPPHDPAHAHGILQLRATLQATPYQILHAHDGRGQTLAWLASVGMSVCRVASRRVTFLPADRWSHRLKYAHTCDAIIAVSEFIRGLLIRAGVPESKIEVIADGIEIPAEVPNAAAKAAIRAQWGFTHDQFLVGFLGAFTREKGVDVACEAFGLLSESLPQARLLLAGEEAAEKSADLTRKLENIRGRAHLCGPVEDLAGFFPGLDLFIMPSRAEGLGSSALLAMAYGLPVVASRAGGLPEIVAEGETGWLVPADSPSALAEAIVAAVSNRAQLRQFGQNARQKAQRFSADIMLERTEAVYYRLLSY